MSNNDTLKELKKITKLLTFAYSDKIEAELSKVANTDNRKMMWVLIDGIRGAPQIADAIKVYASTVRDFLNAAKSAGLIEYQRNNPPVKIIDYVPPVWIELLPVSPEVEEEQNE